MSKGAFTIEDVLSLLDEIEPKRGGRAHEALVMSLREGPLAELYRQIEQMAEDAGTDRELVGWEREAVLHHRTVDRLLGSGSSEPLAELFGDDALEIDLQALLNVCGARRQRGGGNSERLEGIEQTLRLMLAVQRQRAAEGEEGSAEGADQEGAGGRSVEAAG